MRFRMLIWVTLCLFSGSVLSQVKVVKPVKPVKTRPLTTRLGIGAGIAGSVLYLERNVKENNEARGYHFSMVYGLGRLFRSSLEYTQYQTIDIVPTWYSIKANTFEWNLHIMARFSEGKAFFYPIFGLSFNRFSGYFTGLNDFLNLKAIYGYNTEVRNNWMGLNIGAGYEYYFRSWSFFLDYKMRVGVSDGYKSINIMDVCLSSGFRFNLKVPTLYNLFRGTRSRYLLKLNPKK